MILLVFKKMRGNTAINHELKFDKVFRHLNASKEPGKRTNISNSG